MACRTSTQVTRKLTQLGIRVNRPGVSGAHHIIAFTPGESASLLARRPYDLRHAAVCTRLNAGVPAPQVAEWAGHSVDVLLRVYAKCISGQRDEAKRRIEEATCPRDDE